MKQTKCEQRRRAIESGAEHARTRGTARRAEEPDGDGGGGLDEYPVDPSVYRARIEGFAIDPDEPGPHDFEMLSERWH